MNCFRLHCIVTTISLLVGLLASSAFAQRDLKDIPPPDPAEELASFQVDPAFEVNLYAADPLLAKPIQMNFDPAGRLWVASSEIYPHILPGQPANDKILVLEDTDRDGRAEKTHVFAEGLLIPTGIEPGDGGAYVGNSTELLHFRDTDGDLKADSVETVLSGFGTEDTHHILHTFRWGHDGRLYFNQSIYIHSHIETPYGVARLGGGGIWRFSPAARRLEVFSRGWVNAWGHHFDRFGQSFVTDGAGAEGINYTFPGAAFATAVGTPRVLRGLNPGSPKHCGLEVLSGRHIPESYVGDLITHDFRGHRVCRFKLTEDESGFQSREQPELIKTTHVAFRPVDVKLGPDGAIYIADWYNPIIQHGEVDFRDPRRDHTHGRIWRVTAKDRPLVDRPALTTMSTAELARRLADPEQWTRHQARRALASRPIDEVLPVLFGFLRSLSSGETDDPTRLEILWTYQTLDRPAPELTDQLLAAQDHRVRAAAARVVATSMQPSEEDFMRLAPLAADDNARVRLEAVRGLSRYGARGASTALAALEYPVDGNLDYALWLTARETADVWLPLASAGKFLPDHPRQALFALSAVDQPSAVPPALKLLHGGRLADDLEQQALAIIATHGAPPDLAEVLELALSDSKRPAESRAGLLRMLTDSTARRKAVPAGDLARVQPLLAAVQPAALTSAALDAVGAWKLQSLREAVQELAEDVKRPEDVRRAAVACLGKLGGENTAPMLEEIGGNPNESSIVRVAAVSSLADLQLPRAARLAAQQLASASGGFDPAPLIAVFTSRAPGSAALTKALSDVKLPPDLAKLAARAVRASGKPDEALITALRASGGLGQAAGPPTPERLAALTKQAIEHGNAEQGERIFRRADLQCLKCHAIGGSGGQVGPDFTSLGASAQMDYLVESMLEPSKKIKENYHSLIVLTSEGRVVTGIKLRETDRELILRDAEDREVSVPRDQIEEQSLGQSLMPVGLMDDLTQNELVDLVRFLSELGKVGRYAVGREMVVRRWQALVPNESAAIKMRRDRIGSVATNDPAFTWQPAYSRVDGSLPLADVPVFDRRTNKFMQIPELTIVRFQLQAAGAGSILLKLNDATAVEGWLDGQPLAVANEMKLDVSPGLHTVTLSVDRQHRSDELRCELIDVPGSPAQARLVGGK